MKIGSIFCKYLNQFRKTRIRLCRRRGPQARANIGETTALATANAGAGGNTGSAHVASDAIFRDQRVIRVCTAPSTAQSRPAALKGEPVLIATPAQLRAVASPVKQEILNAVAAMGPISVAELARMLGRAPSGLYFHIDKLAKLGLLLRSESGSKRATPSAFYPERASASYNVPSRPIKVAYRPTDAKTRSPLAKAVRSMTTVASRNFVKAYRQGAVVSGAQRTLWAWRWKRRLVPRELEALNRHLLDIERLLTQSDRGRAGPRRLIEFTFVLTPAPDRPYRRRRRP